MTPTAAMTRIARPGGSLTLLRGRKPDRRTEVEELRMEVQAAGFEMIAASRQITNALLSGHIAAAMHFAARLGLLGRGYTGPERAA